MKNSIILAVALLLNFQGLANNASSISENVKPNFDSIQTLFQKVQAFEQVEIVVNFDSLIAGRRKDTERAATITFKRAFNFYSFHFVNTPWIIEIEKCQKVKC